MHFFFKRVANIFKAINGKTALHFAAKSENKAIIMTLLKTGREINTGTYNVGKYNWQKKFFVSQTPLYCVAQNRHLAIA